MTGHFVKVSKSIAALVLVALFVSSVLVATSRAQTINEYAIPTASSVPWNLAVDTSGNVWFTESSGNKIGKLLTGVITEYAIPTASSSPKGIAVDSSGNIWFAEDAANKIGKINQTGVFSEYIIPTSGSEPQDLVADTSGNIWFTEKVGNKIGKLTISTGAITEYNVPTANSRPYGITVDSSGNLWFTEQQGNKIGKMTPGGSFTEYLVPSSGAGPVGIVVDGSGNIWFCEIAGNRIGKMTSTGTFTEFTVPTANSYPAYIALDSSGNLWFTEQQGNRIGEMTPTGVFTEYAVPTTGILGGITIDRLGVIWFVERGANRIGSISFPDFKISSTPTSLTVAQASSITSIITIRSLAAFSSSVILSSSWVGGVTPAEVTVDFNSTSLTPPVGGSKNATLTLTTTSSTPTGSYTLRVTGTSGALSHYVDIAVAVSAAAFDFTVNVSPASQTVNQGQSCTYGVTVSLTSGTGQPVDLSIAGLPTDTAYTFNPASGTPTYASTLTVETSSATPTGTFTLTITGSGGGISRSKTVTLKVNPAATPTVTPTPTPTPTPSPTPPPGGCLVATATYGSELSPEVQFLRGFRDGQVLSTFAGSEFMKAFNAWYYSFSPSVASFIASNPTVKAAMKILLYPLVGILHLSASAYAVFNFNPELAVCIAGLVASGLIGVVYFSPFALVILGILRRTRRLSLSVRNVVPLAYIWVACAGFLTLSILTLSPVAMMASSAIFALATIGLTSLSTALKILQRFP